MSAVRLGSTLALVTACLLSFSPSLTPTTVAQVPGPQVSGAGSLPSATTGLPGPGLLAGPIPRGCEAARPMVPSTTAAAFPRVTVDILDGLYLPSELTVRPGTVVVFRNLGMLPHTATSWDNWNSGVLRSGDSCAILAVTPGTYTILSIVVADGGTPTGTLTVAGEPLPGTGTLPGGAPTGGTGPGAAPGGPAPGGTTPGGTAPGSSGPTGATGPGTGQGGPAQPTGPAGNPTP